MPSSSQMERKFNAAVNVIRGLPKNGSYQPSNEMMLRFYSYYKQATQGSCTQPKPAFWDVVGRAKYDSYKALGNMPKERAMELYVEELKKIVETMSYTDNVAEFMGSISELNGIEVDVNTLQAVAPEAIRSARTNSNQQFASREGNPIHVSNENGYINGKPEHSTANGYTYNQESIQNDHSSDQHSDDEYIDTVEDDVYMLREPFVQNRTPRLTTRRSFDSGSQMKEITTTSSNSATTYKQIEPAIQQILHTIESMRNDLQCINSRIDIVERSMTEVKNHQLRKKVGVNVDINVLNSTTVTIAKHSKLKIMALRYPRWWPFSDISPNWFFILILWPFMARQLARMLQRKTK